MYFDRRGDWMQTYTGHPFWPIDPRPEEVRIEDIAHGLSMLCRYGGHCLRFYSVAEHSVHMARKASRPNRLWALLHDAPEAYIVDIPRPLKRSLPDYRAAEAAVQDAVCWRFGMSTTMPKEVHDLDQRILADEVSQNMAPCVIPWSHMPEPVGVTLQFWSPEEAKARFLHLFQIIVDEIEADLQSAA